MLEKIESLRDQSTNKFTGIVQSVKLVVKRSPVEKENPAGLFCGYSNDDHLQLHERRFSVRVWTCALTGPTDGRTLYTVIQNLAGHGV